VHDPGLSGGGAEPVRPERSEPGGWGLALIERLCLRWGSERPDGYWVWAELPAQGEALGRACRPVMRDANMDLPERS
jgi:hypothetical protein